MNTTRRFLLLGFAALGTLAAVTAGAGWVLKDLATRDQRTSPAPAVPGLVSFGHVDVEPGVISLSPVLPGRVAHVSVREGEAVAAGAVLVRLDDRLFRIKTQQAEADLAAARAQLFQLRSLPEQHRARVAQQQAAIDAAQSKLAAGRLELARKRNLHERDLLAIEELRVAEELVKVLEAAERAEREKLTDLWEVVPEAEIARAEAAVAAKEGQLNEARHHLDECALRAPSAGTVLRILVGAGDILGAQPRQPAVLFCPATPRIVRAEVDQEFAGRVAVGVDVLLIDERGGKGSWRGKVVRLSDWYARPRSVLNEPLQFNDVRTLECIIELDADQPVPRIGQRLRVLI
jgi:multidrug resistance efflux pump